MSSTKLFAILLLTFFSTVVYGATISTSVSCNSTDAGYTQGVVGSYVYEHCHILDYNPYYCGLQVCQHYGVSDSSASASINEATVTADWSNYQAVGLAFPSASYDNDFEITFFGGVSNPSLPTWANPGGGFFEPCFQLSIGGDSASTSTAAATLTTGGASHTWTASPGAPITTCLGRSLIVPFQFGEPIQFHVALTAQAKNPWGGGAQFHSGSASASFLFSVTAVQLVAQDNGTCCGGAPVDSWQLLDLSIPEPGTAGLLLVPIGVVVLVHRKWWRYLVCVK